MASSNQGNQGNQGKQNQMGNRGDNPGSGKSERGFASMDPQRQREIASEGGKAAHQSGKAHQFTSREASEAGRKGGQASRGGNRSANRGAARATTKALAKGKGTTSEVTRPAAARMITKAATGAAATKQPCYTT